VCSRSPLAHVYNTVGSDRDLSRRGWAWFCVASGIHARCPRGRLHPHQLQFTKSAKSGPLLPRSYGADGWAQKRRHDVVLQVMYLGAIFSLLPGLPSSGRNPDTSFLPINSTDLSRWIVMITQHLRGRSNVRSRVSEACGLRIPLTPRLLSGISIF
jgi:hypothetical protein